MGNGTYSPGTAAANVAPVNIVTPPKATNADVESFDVRISRTALAQMQDVPGVPGLKPGEDKWGEIERWLSELVRAARTGRRARNDEKRARWRKTLAGERAKPPMRRGYSNLSVPLTIWAAAAVRARVRTGTIESDPIISCLPSGGGSADAPDLQLASKQIVDFFTSDFRNPRGLAGAIACDAIGAESSDIGMSGLKVHIEPDRVRYYFDVNKGGINRAISQGRVRWDHLAADDLIYPIGYGDDTQAMPFIGHEFPATWQELLMMRESGYLDADALDGLKGMGNTGAPGASGHVAFTTYSCGELYFDYPLFTDGLPVALCAYMEVEQGILLGLRYSYAPRGVRPVWIFNFDRNPDPTNPEGQGVCEKLDGTQDETDVVHNLGIESAKRAIAHVIAIKRDTMAAEEFGGDVPILPGDNIVTETPDEDIKITPLGSPDGMQAALAQEANSLRYVMRLLGLDESALGNVESGKRVPASLGLEIKKDSRVITAHAISNFGIKATEAVYFTIELYKIRLPLDVMIASVGKDGATLLQQSVFSASDVNTRDRYIINFNATDAAATEESRKQQLIVVGQYLQAYYDRIIQYCQLAATLPPPLQMALLDIMQKMENGTRALLTTIDDIKNPDDLLPKVADLATALEGVAAGAAGTGTANNAGYRGANAGAGVT